MKKELLKAVRLMQQAENMLQGFSERMRERVLANILEIIDEPGEVTPELTKRIEELIEVEKRRLQKFKSIKSQTCGCEFGVLKNSVDGKQYEATRASV